MKPVPEQTMVLLFSYGTLQRPDVQISSFGRLLNGHDDEIPGYRKEVLEITDPDVIATSGERFHPIIMKSDDPACRISGHVFEVTADELWAADAYEVSAYKRVEVRLESGRQA